MTVIRTADECGSLSPQGYPCELPRGHGGLCDYEDGRFDWEKESPPADPEETTHERVGCYSNGDPR